MGVQIADERLQVLVSFLFSLLTRARGVFNNAIPVCARADAARRAFNLFPFRARAASVVRADGVVCENVKREGEWMVI